eukprot:SM000003S11223  [mRNA]  locus=s3:1592602:1595790:+ [translate_table: standard]
MATLREKVMSMEKLLTAANDDHIADGLATKDSTITVCLTSQDCKLQELPEELFTFPALAQLQVAGHELTSLPPSIARLTSLTKLDVSGNKLTRSLAHVSGCSLPAEIGSLPFLEDLDASRNLLTALPAEIGCLHALKFLNLMANELVDLPEEIGELSALYRLGLKSNKLRHVSLGGTLCNTLCLIALFCWLVALHLPESVGKMTGLVEVFLTDNVLERLPSSFGSLKKLFKLQASFNRLRSLPEEMGNLPNLELLRVAVNDITSIPAEFGGLDKLAWLSLAGNPACPSTPPGREAIQRLEYQELSLDTLLGDGASGDVFAAIWRGRTVAFKRFKAETSPDGHSSSEIAITCAMEHPNLINVIGIVDEPKGLVVELVKGRPLAAKPNFQSLLRCRWEEGVLFTTDYILRAANGVASALAYMHQKHICHGDVYAHNVIVADDGFAVLCDYGASFCYQPGPVNYEAHEVRAFGLLLNDLVTRLGSDADGSTVKERQGKLVLRKPTL